MWNWQKWRQTKELKMKLYEGLQEIKHNGSFDFRKHKSARNVK